MLRERERKSTEREFCVRETKREKGRQRERQRETERKISRGRLLKKLTTDGIAPPTQPLYPCKTIITVQQFLGAKEQKPTHMTGLILTLTT